MSCGCKKTSVGQTVVKPASSSCGCKSQTTVKAPSTSCGCNKGTKSGCKTFNIGVWNAKTIYQNSKEVQDFVKYHGAFYAFINECQPTACVDPEEDTKNGTVRGQYWLQIVKDGLTPLFQIDDDNHLMISWDNGETWGHVTNNNGDLVDLVGPAGKEGPAGKDGVGVESITSNATVAYDDDLTDPTVDVTASFDKSTKTAHFEFQFRFPRLSPAKTGRLEIYPDVVTIDPDDDEIVLDYIADNIDPKTLKVESIGLGVESAVLRKDNNSIEVKLKKNTRAIIVENTITISGVDKKGNTITAQSVVKQSAADAYARIEVDDIEKYIVEFTSDGTKLYENVKVLSNTTWTLK